MLTAQPSDPNRYYVLPGRRYFDTDTDSSISRRQYIKRITGLTPEQLVKRAPDDHTRKPRVESLRLWREGLEIYRASHPEKSLRQSRKDFRVATAMTSSIGKYDPGKYMKTKEWRYWYKFLWVDDAEIRNDAMDALHIVPEDFRYVENA